MQDLMGARTVGCVCMFTHVCVCACVCTWAFFTGYTVCPLDPGLMCFLPEDGPGWTIDCPLHCVGRKCTTEAGAQGHREVRVFTSLAPVPSDYL